MVVESVALGLRGIAAITDLPTALGSWPAICTTMPLAPAIDPNTMKASASPALRCKLGDRKQSTSECVLYAERMASCCKPYPQRWIPLNTSVADVD
jgi:hypothetical protein